MFKTIKKYMVSITLIFMSLFAIAGCGWEGNEYVGSYKVTSYVNSELNVSREEYMANPSSYDEWDISGWFEMTVKLNKNGKFEQHQERSLYVQEGVWRIRKTLQSRIIYNYKLKIYLTIYC